MVYNEVDHFGLGGDTIHKILSIDKKKYIALINAGFQEFSTYGKDRASLNAILKKASMSKGVFYHYFVDKHDFYVFLIKYAGNYITKELEEESLMEEQDFIKRLVKSFLVKTDVFRTFQHVSHFLIKIYQENEVEWVQGIINKENNNYETRVVHENVNYDMFRTKDNNANIRVAGRYMHTVFNTIISSIHTMTYEQVNEFLTQEASYLRKVLYKEEYQ